MKANQVYFPTLEAEISRRGVKKKDIAEALGITPRAFSLKMSGKIGFWYKETCIIKEKFFPDMSQDELFTSKEKAGQI